MPENHRQYLTYTKDDFQSWASTVGPNTEKVVRFFLESGKAPEQGFKSCVSLKKYADRYKSERIEEACRQILLFSGDPSIRGIQALLKSPVKKDGKTEPIIYPKDRITAGAAALPVAQNSSGKEAMKNDRPPNRAKNCVP